MLPITAHFLALQPAVDQVLRRWLDVVPPHLRGAAAAAVGSGRRFRPTLLAALLGTRFHTDDRAADAAVAIELLHRASLVVDDVVDGDSQRRGSPVFNIEWGEDYAAVLPHVLAGEALRSVATNPDLQQYAIAAYRRMAVGQLADLRPDVSSGSLFKFYQEYVLDKTRPLFELVLLTAATCTGAVAPADAIRVGARIGDVFQMANDLFDTEPALQVTRGGKRFAVINLDLLLALAVERGTVTAHDVLEFAGKRLSARELRPLTRRVTSLRVRRAGMDVISRAVQDAYDDIMRLPPDWQPLVRETLAWIITPEFWNHGEHERAGYVRPSAVA